MEDGLVEYFIINSELNMSVGKVCAQIGHVATIIAVAGIFKNTVKLFE